MLIDYPTHLSIINIILTGTSINEMACIIQFIVYIVVKIV